MSGIQGSVLQTHPPLVVDLDGTLLRSDLLFETAMAFIRQHPLQVFKLLLWLLQGKASLKRGLALATRLDIALLPYDAEVIEYIEVQRNTGRLIVLATAAHTKHWPHELPGTSICSIRCGRPMARPTCRPIASVTC